MAGEVEVHSAVPCPQMDDRSLHSSESVEQSFGMCEGASSSCVRRMRMFGDFGRRRRRAGGSEQWMGGRLRGYSRPIVVGTGTTLDLSKERNCLWICQIGPGYSSLGGFDVYGHNEE